MNCTFSKNNLNSVNLPTSDKLLLLSFLNSSIFQNWYGDTEPSISNGDTLINSKNESLNINSILAILKDVYYQSDDRENVLVDSMLQNQKNNSELNIELAKHIGIEPMDDELVSNVPTDFENELKEKLIDILSQFTKVIEDVNNPEIYSENSINIAHVPYDSFLVDFIPSLLTEEDRLLVDTVINEFSPENINNTYLNKKIIVSNLLPKIYTQPKKIQKGLYNILKNISLKLGIEDMVLSSEVNMFNILKGIDDLENLDYIDYTLNSKKYNNVRNEEYSSYIGQSLRKFIFSVILDNLKNKFNIDYIWVKSDLPFTGRFINGIVEINENNFNDDTPFHEYLHPIILALKAENIDLYNSFINDPEVLLLTDKLSRTNEYKDYPEEEALVRILSKEFNSLSTKTIFKQFFIWLKNFLRDFFNIKVNRLRISSNVSDIVKMMLDSNQYLLTTNYLQRYNYDLYDDFLNIQKTTKTLTPQQQEVVDKLQINRDKITGTIDKDFKDGYYTLEDTSELKRVTSIDLKSLDGLGPELALVGTFQHSVVSEYLRLRLTTPENKPLVYEVELDSTKKFYKYPDGYKANPRSVVETETNKYLNPNKKDMYDDISKEPLDRKTPPLTRFIVETIRNDAELSKLFPELNDVYISYLYKIMITLEEKILDEINTAEDQNWEFKDLLIFNELFIHNYNKVPSKDLYGGTVDIFVISPSGKKYNIDLKTAGKSRMEKTDTELVEIAEKMYTMQQSMYKEMLALATDDVTNIADIESLIIHIPRYIEYIWNESVIERFIKTIKNHIKNNTIDDVSKNLYLTNLAEVFKDKEHRNSKMKQLSFTDTIMQDPNRFITSLKTLKQYLSDNGIAIPKPNITKVIVDNLPYNNRERVRIIPIKYNRTVLEENNVRILKPVLYNEFVQELLDMVGSIDKIMFILEDDIKNIENITKIGLDWKLESKLIKFKEKLKSLKNTKLLIKSQLSILLAKDDINDNEIATTKNTIKNSSESWDYFSKGIRNSSKREFKNKDYAEYFRKISSTINKIEDSIELQKNIIKAQENDLSKLIVSVAVLEAKMRDYLSKLPEALVLDDDNLIFNDKIFNDMNNELLSKQLEIRDLRNSNKLYQDHINDLSSFLQNYKATRNSLNVKNSLSTIINDAKYHLSNIKDKIIPLLQNPAIEVRVRAGYLTYVEKTINLYKDINLWLDNILSVEEVPYEDGDIDAFRKELSRINTDFKILSLPDSIVNKSWKIIIADMISFYKKDVVNLKHEENEIATNLELYKLWMANANSLYKHYRINAEANIIAYFSTKPDESVLNTKKEQILRIIEQKRRLVVSNLDQEINAVLESPALNIVNEHLLSAARSNFTLVSLLALMDTEINREYAGKYKKVSEEIQQETAILLGTYDNTFTNIIKLGDFTFTQEQYEVFDNFISYTENKELAVGGVDYLLSVIGNDGKNFKYELIFDDWDRQAIEKLNDNDKKRYIIDNNLVEKYRNVKTLSLIDRAKYGFKDKFKLHTMKLKLLSDNLFKNFNDGYHDYIKTNNKDLLESAISYLKDKNKYAQSYNIKKLHFKSYLQYIVDLYERMKIVNDTISSKIYSEYKDSFLYDIESLLSEEQYNMLKNIIDNDDAVIDKSLLENNKGEFFILDILKVLENIPSNRDIETISDLLEIEEMDYLDNLYGKNYSSIFLLEGRTSFEKYFNLENGKLSTEIKKIEAQNNFQSNIERDNLELALRNYEELHSKEMDDLKKGEIEKKIVEINNQINDLDNRQEILIKNDQLVEMIKNNPFTYLVTKEISGDKTKESIIKTLLSGIRLSNIYNLSISDEETFNTYKIINLPKGVNNINESALKQEDFDPKWEIFEEEESLFKYYNYLRNLLGYFYSILPASEINYMDNLSLPYMENKNLILILEEMKGKGFSPSQIKEYFEKVFIESITSAVQNTEGGKNSLTRQEMKERNYSDDQIKEELQNQTSQPSIAIKPIKFNDITDLYKVTRDANYQLHLVLQMLAYNAILFKSRSDTLPLHNIIRNIALQSNNSSMQEGVLFNYHANLIGNVRRIVSPDSETNLTSEDRENLRDWELQVEELNRLILPYKNKKLTITDKAKKELLLAKRKDYQAKITAMYNRRKFDKIDIARLLINNVRLVQLTYSLTGQVGNFINGMIQTSVVSSGTTKEREAYAKSFKILNGLLLENKALLGGVYVGNMVTSSILGSGMGLLSMPVWLMLTQAGLDKYKNLDWLKSRFNPDVKKALNMERNYNITYDVTEQARSNVLEQQRYTYDKSTKTVVESDRDFIELLKPFGFIKRAEKLLAIQNMIIQSFVTEVTINGKVISWWDLHGEDGTIKNEYKPFVTPSDITKNETQLNDRLWRANGNYTSKYQLENYWWGQLFLVYAKWIPETINNYLGEYRSAEKNIYTDEPSEGLLRSSWKRGVELSYNLLGNVMIDDFKPEYIDDIPARISNLPGQSGTINTSSNKFDRIIVYKNGEIIKNNKDKKRFIDEYNEQVSNFEYNLTQMEKDEDPDEYREKLYAEFQETIERLASQFDIKELRDITVEERSDIFKSLTSVFISFISPFDFVKSFQERTVTRNVFDRISKIFPESPGTIGYQKLQQANLRKFYNFTHILWSMFITKTLLSITYGILTGVLDIDDDKKYIRQMTFIINRYNQLWEDISFYSNPISAFYKFFHNSMTSVKFLLDLFKWNIDLMAAFPHIINKLLGDSEMGDIILESMGLRDPFIEKSRGVTNVRPVNDFIDMIPLFNKISGIYKQSMNDYSNYDAN